MHPLRLYETYLIIDYDDICLHNLLATLKGIYYIIKQNLKVILYSLLIYLFT